MAWGQADTPYQIQFAFPVENATNELHRLAINWLPLANSNLVNSPLEPLRVYTNVAQISTRLLVLVPFLRRAPESNGEFLNGGVFPVKPGPNEPPPELFAELNRTNLIYYDWEITKFRLRQLRETLNVLAALLTLPEMGTNSATSKWLDAAASKLGNAITEVTVSSPQEISLVRRSHLGLNGLELLTLANWIASTNFPHVDLNVGFRPAPKPRVTKTPAASRTPGR